MRFLLMAFLATLTAITGYTHARVVPNTETHNDNFVLEGYASSAWSEIATDQYTVLPSGYVLKRSIDDSGAGVNWENYTAYRWSGQIVDNSGATEINQEEITFAETALGYPIDADNVTDLDTAQYVTATELRAGNVLRGDENGIESARVQLGEILRVGKGQQTRRPRTLANVDNGGGGGEWTNPEYARRYDDARAETFTTGGDPAEITQVLRATNFNFKIPRKATITGVELELIGYNDPESAVLNYTAALTAGGETKAYTFDTFPTDQTATTIAALDTWSATLSSEIVNAADFGVDIYAGNYYPIDSVTNYVNSIRLTVYYTTATTGTTVLDVSGDVGIAGNVNLSPIATPTNAAESSDANVYIKDGKLIVQYDDAGTVRYKYLDMTGTGTSWAHTTTAP